MTAPILAAATFLIAISAVQITSIAIAAARLRRSAPQKPVFDRYPPVSLVRPLCGIDNFAAETLRSTFELDYPCYEILFCVASAADPVLPLVKNLMAVHPKAAVRESQAEQRGQGLARRRASVDRHHRQQCADAA